MFLVCHRRVVFIRCVVYRMLTAGIDSSPLLFEGLSTCWSLIKGISSHLFLVRENLASRIFRVSFSFYFFFTWSMRLANILCDATGHAEIVSISAFSKTGSSNTIIGVTYVKVSFSLIWTCIMLAFIDYWVCRFHSMVNRGISLTFTHSRKSGQRLAPKDCCFLVPSR